MPSEECGLKLARYLPEVVPLVAMDRQIMRQQLRRAYAGAGDGGIHDKAVLKALPPDGALSGLISIALNVALRAPDAMAAARRLAGFLKEEEAGGPKMSGASKVPSLEEIPGDGEALVAARQLVADLKLWHRIRSAPPPGC